MWTQQILMKTLAVTVVIISVIWTITGIEPMMFGSSVCQSSQCAPQRIHFCLSGKESSKGTVTKSEAAAPSQDPTVATPFVTLYENVSEGKARGKDSEAAAPSQDPAATPFVNIYEYVSEGKAKGPFKDCLQALEEGHTNSGTYLVKPENFNKVMPVWCEQRDNSGGWTVIQRCMDGSVNFYRNWETYKEGFGNTDGEYWIGLENIYWLTNQGSYKLLVTLEDWSGSKRFAEYASFRIESELDFYKLRLGSYHGSAGDSLTWHNGQQFTTLDRDHDAYTGNCAHYQKGGWWYNACAHCNLNGVWYRGGQYRSRYQDGVYWANFGGGSYSVKKVTMMICPN